MKEITDSNGNNSKNKNLFIIHQRAMNENTNGLIFFPKR